MSEVGAYFMPAVFEQVKAVPAIIFRNAFDALRATIVLLEWGQPPY
jgi:hypothetical protein